MASLNLRNRLQQGEALTVGAIAGHEGLALPLENITDQCDIVELRLDSLGWNNAVLEFAEKCPLPLLITARGPEEGGAGALSLKERHEGYRTLMTHAALIDIELRDFELFTELLEEAKTAGIIVIGSFHDFEKTPASAELRSKIGKTADVHKFAVKIQTKQDLSELLEVFDAPTAISAMGMGPLGGAARPLTAKAGSVLNYGFLGDTPTAPGQWPAKLLKDAIAL